MTHSRKRRIDETAANLPASVGLIIRKSHFLVLHDVQQPHGLFKRRHVVLVTTKNGPAVFDSPQTAKPGGLPAHSINPLIILAMTSIRLRRA